MGKTATNLSVVLGLITVAFGGFYLYTQYEGSSLDFAVSEQTTQNMLNNTRVFIERGDVLEQITLDINFFEDERFRSLHSYTTPIEERPIGRQDPFADTTFRAVGTNF